MIGAIYEQHSYYNFTNPSAISPNMKQFGIKTFFAPPRYLDPCDISFTFFDTILEVYNFVRHRSESIFKEKEIPMKTSFVMPLD